MGAANSACQGCFGNEPDEPPSPKTPRYTQVSKRSKFEKYRADTSPSTKLHNFLTKLMNQKTLPMEIELLLEDMTSQKQETLVILMQEKQRKDIKKMHIPHILMTLI